MEGFFNSIVKSLSIVLKIFTRFKDFYNGRKSLSMCSLRRLEGIYNRHPKILLAAVKNVTIGPTATLRYW